LKGETLRAFTPAEMKPIHRSSATRLRAPTVTNGPSGPKFHRERDSGHSASLGHGLRKPRAWRIATVVSYHHLARRYPPSASHPWASSGRWPTAASRLSRDW
jgi:hypothetical protein